ncbi:uncharacterized protein [Hemitrygon akajei]|uniref:uncharacterized protein isoform X2 n=1 Tax=Hemitrygon akajei TaxID=2704970 RepID=UPI003BF96905
MDLLSRTLQCLFSGREQPLSVLARRCKRLQMPEPGATNNLLEELLYVHLLPRGRACDMSNCQMPPDLLSSSSVLRVLIYVVSLHSWSQAFKNWCYGLLLLCIKNLDSSTDWDTPGGQGPVGVRDLQLQLKLRISMGGGFSFSDSTFTFGVRTRGRPHSSPIKLSRETETLRQQPVSTDVRRPLHNFMDKY